MIRSVLILLGALLFLAPLKWLSSLVPVPAYRTGTLQDLALALSAGAALYGGVLAGVLVLWRLETGRGGPMKGLAVFFAGWIGAVAGVGLAMAIWFFHEWLTKGRVFALGQSLALLPVFPIIGGIIGLVIAGGAGLVAFGVRRPAA